MRVSKMVLNWSVLFTLPTCIALTLWNPPDEVYQRHMLEQKCTQTQGERKRRVQQFKELLSNLDSEENQTKLQKMIRPKPPVERH